MKYIPNIISIFRIILIPFFVFQMINGNTLNAGLILIFSGFTDFIDGYLARKFNWITDFGKVLDPAADKLTQAAVSLTLAYILRQYWYFFAIMIFKDLGMIIIGSYLMKNNVKIEGAKIFGKVSTFVYYIGMTLIVLIPSMPKNIIFIILCTATICAIIAALFYIPEFKRYRKNMKN
ncbi:CDP-alcohol phosphatidyltransferase family protein [Miniphocaeibacter massiliensis]|uniref:CDP-alcohol phosphatidyltransferase family protein n=1 Tax=Miniphocaeibacter massiliensis TaxID=2041841 RepID=UPI0013EAC582|nr:CDP-alcohol phosphatidyltransferase family protein [Miniphocaeibacter massiliensis]